MDRTILFVEKDSGYREKVSSQLERLGYLLLPVGEKHDKVRNTLISNLELDEGAMPGVILMSANNHPDPGDANGILNLFGKKHGRPIILYGDEVALKRATPRFSGYNCTVLLKPLRIPELSINLEMAMQDKLSCSPFRPPLKAFKPGVMHNSIFIPQDAMHHRLAKSDIIYAEADGSYTRVVTDERQFQLSLNLKHFVGQLQDQQFIRVSRKHLINANRITRIEGNTIILGAKQLIEIQMSQSKKSEIMSRFKIFKTK